MPPLAAVPALIGKIGGSIIGGLVTADFIDTMIGSPLKSWLGIKVEDHWDAHKIQKEQKKVAREQEKQQYALGLSRYLRNLEGDAPTWVAKNRLMLAGRFKKQVDYQNQHVKQSRRLMDQARAPLYSIPKEQPALRTVRSTQRRDYDYDKASGYR